MSLITRLSASQRLLALSRPSVFASGHSALKSTGSPQEQMDEYWAKNKRLNRPMSPHMTIYNLHHVTSAMSVTHRATGIALAGVTTAFAFGSVFLPQNLDQAILSLQSFGESWFGYMMLMEVKFLLVWPIIFHTLNGIRHLVWDTGKGFEMSDLRKSGYVVTALSVIISAAIVYLYK